MEARNPRSAARERSECEFAAQELEPAHLRPPRHRHPPEQSAFALAPAAFALAPAAIALAPPAFAHAPAALSTAALVATLAVAATTFALAPAALAAAAALAPAAFALAAATFPLAAGDLLYRHLRTLHRRSSRPELHSLAQLSVGLQQQPNVLHRADAARHWKAPVSGRDVDQPLLYAVGLRLSPHT